MSSQSLSRPSPQSLMKAENAERSRELRTPHRALRLAAQDRRPIFASSGLFLAASPDAQERLDAALLRLSEAVDGANARLDLTSSPETVARAGFSGGGGAVPHKAAMEQSFGTSFGDVQSYTGPAASAACDALGAKAYAMGNQVAFKSDSPDASLVAHELTHVVQQTEREGVVARSGGGDRGAAEAEAEAVEAAVASGQSARSALADSSESTSLRLAPEEESAQAAPEAGSEAPQTIDMMVWTDEQGQQLGCDQATFDAQVKEALKTLRVVVDNFRHVNVQSVTSRWDEVTRLNDEWALTSWVMEFLGGVSAPDRAVLDMAECAADAAIGAAAGSGVEGLEATITACEAAEKALDDAANALNAYIDGLQLGISRAKTGTKMAGLTALGCLTAATLGPVALAGVTAAGAEGAVATISAGAITGFVTGSATGFVGSATGQLEKDGEIDPAQLVKDVLREGVTGAVGGVVAGWLAGKIAPSIVARLGLEEYGAKVVESVLKGSMGRSFRAFLADCVVELESPDKLSVEDFILHIVVAFCAGGLAGALGPACKIEVVPAPAPAG